MQSLWTIGNQIYRIHVWREAHRLVVFLIRGMLHHGKLARLDEYFSSTPELRQIADAYPYVYEQPTRAFFYKNSTFDERVRLVEHHMQFLLEKLKPEVVIGLYRKEEQMLWQQELGGVDTRCYLSYHPGQRKEGLMSLWLRQGDDSLYQIMFWLDQDPQRAWSCYIGAMQGPNMDDARDVIKRMTNSLSLAGLPPPTRHPTHLCGHERRILCAESRAQGSEAQDIVQRFLARGGRQAYGGFPF